MKYLKNLCFWFSCVLAIAAGVHAQTSETFDIASFRAPAGWAKEAKDGGLIFTTSDQAKGTYAMIVLYKSVESNAAPSADFDADWQQYAADALGIKSAPQMEPARQVDGRTVTTGGAAFDGDLGPSAVIMSTYSGFGRRFSAAAIFNSQDYVPAIEAFAASLVLSKTTASAPALIAPANNEVSILGTWGKSAGAHMTFGDPVAAGMAGYSKDQYIFNADGTYVFVSKSFRMSYAKILLARESGTYQINGGTLTIRPQKSVIQAWSKLDGADKFGKLLSSQNRKLEAVTYRFTRHYFSGIDQWNLVLQADQPTERDGPFSNNTLFANAWYYSPISANNPVIELPR